MKPRGPITTLLVLLLLPNAPCVALATDAAGPALSARSDVQQSAPQSSSSPKTPKSSSPASQPKTTPAEAKDGQWVHTRQYGWVWLRYAREYTYITPEGYAYSYVYYPGNGWCWLYSPWVFGWGPAPYWGTRGRSRFAWHAHPWFTRPEGPPRAAPASGIRSGAHWGGAGFRGGGHGRR